MTTYWVSNARHYCKECGCWMDAKPSSIRKHEEGYRHKGNVDRLLKKLKRDKIFAEKESNKHAQEFAAIEHAAKRQYVKDCASGLASCGLTFNKNNNHHHSKRKDKNHTQLFLPSDNDTYYYMDKTGNTHGPYSSIQMSKWYHFGFFVDALRIRKRQETEFIHLRDLQNPFNYSDFKHEFHHNIHFRKTIINSIDISDVKTVPPGIDIPQKLKNQFYKLYPKQIKNNKHLQTQTQTHQRQTHQYYSNGIDFKKINNNANNNGMTKKQQRRIFVRGQMRKYKMKCNCGDSDCHLKHNNNNNNDDDDDDDDDRHDVVCDVEIEEKDKKDKKDKIINDDRDEFGFGKWEQVTKEEFDAKHSNKKLFMEREKNKNKKKRWRDKMNSNLPIAKRKKLMGIDDMMSDEERDFDDEYGINEILRMKKEKQKQKQEKEEEDMNNDFQKGYKESKGKIAISIGSNMRLQLKVKQNVHMDGEDNDVMLNEENVMVRDAKLKLKKLQENEKKIEVEKKGLMIEKLNECIVNDGGENENNNNNNGKQQIDKKILSGLFKKKKKKKKNRQNGSTNVKT